MRKAMKCQKKMYCADILFLVREQAILEKRQYIRSKLYALLYRKFSKHVILSIVFLSN